MTIFCNPHQRPDGLQVLVILSSDGKTVIDSINFSTPPGFTYSGDSLAAALMSMFASDYGDVYLDFPISQSCRQSLSSHFKVKIDAPQSINLPHREKRKCTVLNFSGGLDSLACRCLLPADVKLFSVDFGGWFQREADFFKLYPTQICKTDFRIKRYFGSWIAMGAPSLLFADYMKAGYILFGGNMESSLYSLSASRAGKEIVSLPPFCAANVEQGSPTDCLTAFGTAMVVDHFCPDALQPSLTSLSGAGDIKGFRKGLMIECVAEYVRKESVNLNNRKPPKETKFGERFYDDFSTLFFVNRFGYETVSNWVKGLDQLTNAGWNSELDMSFCFKYNPDLIAHTPKHLRKHMLTRLKEGGVLPYNERDWSSYHHMKEVMGRMYSIPD